MFEKGRERSRVENFPSIQWQSFSGLSKRNPSSGHILLLYVANSNKANWNASIDRKEQPSSFPSSSVFPFFSLLFLDPYLFIVSVPSIRNSIELIFNQKARDRVYGNYRNDARTSYRGTNDAIVATRMKFSRRTRRVIIA